MSSIEEAISRVADALFAIRDEMQLARNPLPQPQAFGEIRLVSERRVGDMDLLTYEATLPVMPAGTDVVSQVLSVSVNGTAQPDQELSVLSTTATFEVPQGSSVDLSLVYVDDGGQRSVPRTQSFVAQDTIPPNAPGEFGEIKLVSERTVPDV